MLALLVAMIGVDCTFVVRVLPDFERYKPVPAISRALLAPRLQPTDIVAQLPGGAAEHGVLPRSGTWTSTSTSEPFVQRHPVASTRLRGACRMTTTRTCRRTIGGRTCILYRRPTFDVKLKDVLAREPLPELLLITNQCQVDR